MSLPGYQGHHVYITGLLRKCNKLPHNLQASYASYVPVVLHQAYCSATKPSLLGVVGGKPLALGKWLTHPGQSAAGAGLLATCAHICNSWQCKPAAPCDEMSMLHREMLKLTARL